jgi:predicted RNA-binding protein with PIN domain
VRWLIDGYNVIRRDPDLRARESESLEAGRAALVRLLAAAARVSGDSFVAVFDGARRTGGASGGLSRGTVEVLFSRPPLSADDVLVRLAAEGRSGTVVVSSDRLVQRAASRAGAVAVTTDAFLGALGGQDGEEDEEDDDAPEDGPPAPRGNPRRLSREARAAGRALRRLRPR